MNIQNEIIINTIKIDGEEEKIIKRQTLLLSALNLKLFEIVKYLLDNKYGEINCRNNYFSLRKLEKKKKINDKIEQEN